MKLLFDENLSFRLCRQLSDVFPGSSQVRLAGLERADDMAVWAYAKANDFTIVTLDASNSKSPSQQGPHSFFWPESR